MKKNNIQIMIRTWLVGQYVGHDAFGNKYYQDRRCDQQPRRYAQRWVLYADTPDPTGIPATWHGWLHHTCHSVLQPASQGRPVPQHQINLTGTPSAYYPPSLNLTEDLAKKAVKRYEAWQPHHK